MEDPVSPMSTSTEEAHILRSHTYKGMTVANFILDSSIDAMSTFDVRHDDVWITGTHWMMEIVGLILADGYPDQIDRSLYLTILSATNMVKKLPTTRAEELASPPDMSPFLDRVQAALSPRTIRTHLPLKFLPPNLVTRAKVIYMARNPKDLLNSLFHFHDGTRVHNPPWETVMERFMTGDEIRFGPWFDHVTSFWKIRHEDNVLFLFYEAVKKDPEKYIRKVAEHIGRPLSEAAFERVVEHSTFQGMAKTYQQAADDAAKHGTEDFTVGAGKFKFMRKGVCGQWKERFTVKQNETFDQWLQDKIANSDLKFIFE